MTAAPAPTGPQCPRCSKGIAEEQLRNGQMMCPSCHILFQSVLFHPPERAVAPVATLAVAGPEGASACANHARNAAVTSCMRCGLFICSLCEMNVGEGSLCPSCFDRVRAEGTSRATANRYRDYSSMARTSAIVGLLIFYFMVLFGPVTIYYAAKGMKQRREQGRSRTGPLIALIAGILETIGGLAMIAFLIWAVATTAR